ncbi:hypothetical protein EY643_17985 [Halioglobus maricola]|uniref:Uncharacterized protein n=1 Tax=Halioglobus maricola TaxID=2601894 RepID=A0A5P9NQ33_9GAMM|nr:hypothetical protein [Halioglobus maricola]QFU77404.1 hypothetical protein EY643_17985 [Halioglobus maricola]
MNIENSIRATLSIICIGVFAAGASIAQSADTNDAYLDACRGDVEAYYGEERELAVVKKRRALEGVQLTLSAKSDSDNAEFVNCWVPGNHNASDFKLGANSVATVVAPVPTIR